MNFQDTPGWIRYFGINLYAWNLKRRRFDQKFRQYRAFLEESQYWETERLVVYQTEQLRNLLIEAAENVPFYGRHFASCGFRPSQFSSLSDLTRIEPVSKADLRKAGHQCLHRDYKRFAPQLCYSSGTTGEKFAYYVPKVIRYAFKYATIWRQYSWAGISFLDRRITMGSRNFASKPPFFVRNLSENQLLLSIHHLNEETVEKYLSEIRRFRPVFLQGHPSGIAYLSERLNLSDQTIPLKAIFTTGEVLSPEDKLKIQRAFECSVYEEYGQGECVFSAQESPANKGFHEASEFGLIEFDDLPQGGLRQVLGTSLWNYAMPFIRYRVEDLVEPTSEPWNGSGKLGLPIKLKRVVGRMDERLSNTRQNMVLPVTIRSAIKPIIKEGENYQVAQIGRKAYQLRLVGVSTKRDKNEFKQPLLKIFGDDASLEIVSVDFIRSATGKIRNVVNEYCPPSEKS